ncbi:MAG: hypothetical protein RLZZ466_504, partial [Bacteroidota bacterium]
YIVLLIKNQCLTEENTFATNIGYECETRIILEACLER